MIVLGLDASGDGAGAAVIDATGVRGAAWAGRGVRPAAQLLALVDGALSMAGLARTAIEGLAVAVGPGSYAGIRAAVVTGKALAFAAGLPLAGVGSLQALAVATGPWGGVTWAALDARRGRVYAEGFRWGPELPEAVGGGAALLERDAFRDAVRRSAPGPDCLLTGSGASASDAEALPGARLAPPTAAPALAAAAAWLGRRLLLRGEAADPLALVPAYVSDPVLGPPPAGPATAARMAAGDRT